MSSVARLFLTCALVFTLPLSSFALDDNIIQMVEAGDLEEGDLIQMVNNGDLEESDIGELLHMGLIDEQSLIEYLVEDEGYEYPEAVHIVNGMEMEPEPEMMEAMEPRFEMITPLEIQPIEPDETEEADEPIKEVTLQALSPHLKGIIQESIDQGEMPPEDILEELPPGLREEIVAAIREGMEGREPMVTEEESPQGIQGFFSEYWVQFWALLVGLIGVFLAVSGYSVASSKKKKSISRFINEIDDTFESFKWKSKRCEAELYRLQDVMDEKLKEGKIDESTYHLLVSRIEKYMKEVQDVEDPLRKHKNKK